TVSTVTDGTAGLEEVGHRSALDLTFGRIARGRALALGGGSALFVAVAGSRSDDALVADDRAVRTEDRDQRDEKRAPEHEARHEQPRKDRVVELQVHEERHDD